RVHHAEPGSERVLGAPDGGGLAPHEDLAAVGLVVAVQDAHQGGLAGAVLADDAVDRTRAHRERHVTVGVNVAEPPPNRLAILRSSTAGAASAFTSGPCSR